MNQSIYQVDAFANTIFEGNPAAVCLLDRWLPDLVMQAIAAEMNLSETAFVVKREDDYRIRWFTPTIEVDLCGHATLAAAHVLYEHIGVAKAALKFQSLSGLLIATPIDGQISLDFPASELSTVTLNDDVLRALGGSPISAHASDDLVVVYSDATEIAILDPDIPALATLPYRGICVTAPGNGNGYDFVCRMFAPAAGINEDPVTGSAYTKLGPYYAKALQKNVFRARQLSKRGGDVGVKVDGNRVHISGAAVTVMEATLKLN